MKILLTPILLLVSALSYAQSEKLLQNEDITFIIVEVHSSHCDIYYSDGSYEEIYVDEKAVKISGGDEEETNNSMVIGQILKNGWKLHTITNEQSIPRFYLTR